MERVKSQALLGASGDDAKVKAVPTQGGRSHKITPLDFDQFVPWMCLEWQSPQIVAVKRITQGDIIKFRKDIKTKKDKTKIGALGVPEIVPSASSSASLLDRPYTILAVYDTKSHLVEVAFKEREVMHKKTFHAVNICLNFHSLLTRLTIQNVKIPPNIFEDIVKCLPNSYLTDVCLDDTWMAGESCYHLLLDKESSIKYLSLNRCNIGDAGCRQIAQRIDLGAPGESLVALELSSNNISDAGALDLAESLRRNRHLCHLNLSGNMLTDESAIILLSHLMEFAVRTDEELEASRRKIQYIKRKENTFKVCLQELQKKKPNTMGLVTTKIKPTKVPRSTIMKSKNLMSNYDDVAKATEKAVQLVGELNDPYSEQCVFEENGNIYCRGNIVLSSLNLAYNYLSYITLEKLHKVLKYQDSLEDEYDTRLLRVVLRGNNLPLNCKLYDQIQDLLSKAMYASIALQNTGQRFQKNSSRRSSRPFAK